MYVPYHLIESSDSHGKSVPREYVRTRLGMHEVTVGKREALQMNSSSGRAGIKPRQSGSEPMCLIIASGLLSATLSNACF